MIKYLQLSCFVIFSLFLHAQNNPLIGSQKGDKEKILQIKKGLPDIKKNLTKRIDNDSDDREVMVEIGDENGSFEEDGDEQTLSYQFSRFYFSGTTDEFKAYYQKLLGTIKEVFGDKYDSVEYDKKEKEWCVSFYEKGKRNNSPTGIYVCCDWRLAEGATGTKIMLSFFGTKKN